MRRTWIGVLLVVVAVVGPTGLAQAEGLYDGIWQVQQSNAIITLNFFSSIHQNDMFLDRGFNMIFVSVTPRRSGFSVGRGLLVGNVFKGALFDEGNVQLGTFTIIATDFLHFQGQITVEGFPPFTLVGVRAF